MYRVRRGGVNQYVDGAGVVGYSRSREYDGIPNSGDWKYGVIG